jgi:RNA polymerase sigma factor (sigma-70 family)
MTRRGSFFRPHLVFSARTKAEAEDARATRDQAEQFRLVMLPHMDAAYNLARYLSRDPNTAEDIVQDAFLRAYRGFGSWRGDSAKAWLLTIVRNCFLSSIAGSRERLGTIVAEGDSGIAEPVDEESPETILARKSEAEALRSTIEDLPEPFREALVLRELEELSYKEIAALTAVPIGTVMSRLARARQMLAELLLPATENVRKARS